MSFQFQGHIFFKVICLGIFAFILLGQWSEIGNSEIEDMQQRVTGRIQTHDCCS